MALNFNDSTQCNENRQGVRIRPRGRGTDGLSVVNPDDASSTNFSLPCFKLWKPRDTFLVNP